MSEMLVWLPVFLLLEVIIAGSLAVPETAPGSFWSRWCSPISVAVTLTVRSELTPSYLRDLPAGLYFILLPQVRPKCMVRCRMSSPLLIAFINVVEAHNLSFYLRAYVFNYKL